MGLQPASIDSLEPRHHFAAGDVDLDFSGGAVRGEYHFPATVGYHNLEAAGTLLQADGSVLVYGDGFVARFLRNGALDQSFGRAGVAGFEGVSREGLSAQMDSRGRIVLAGFGIDPGPSLVAVRLLQNGAIDESFAINGRWSTSAETVTLPISITVDRADRPVIGFSIYGEYPETKIQFVRLTQGGNLDRRFGNRGVATLDLVAGSETIEGLHVGPDGKLAFLVDQERQDVLTIAKLNTRGVLDRSFDGNGIAALKFATVSFAYNTQLITLPTGRLSAVFNASLGYDQTAGGAVLAVRLMPDGSRDTDFGGDGVVSSREWFPVRPDRLPALHVNSIGATSDGLLSVFGERLEDGKFVQVKVRGNGSLSPTFGRKGVRELQLTEGLSGELSQGELRRRGDDSITLLRTSGEWSYDRPDFQVISVGADGARDAAFNATDAGRVFTPYSYGTAAVLANGRLLVAAHRNQGVSFYGVAENGTLDPGFGDRGRVIEGDLAAAVLIPSPDGGFVRWGSTSDPSDGDSIAVSIARHGASGFGEPIIPFVGYEEFFISDDSGGGRVTLLPRGWVGITYEMLPFDRRFGLLISPTGQAVDTPFNISAGGESTDFPENDALVGVLPGPGGSVYGFGQMPVRVNDLEVVRDVILRSGGDATLQAFGVDGTVFDVSGVIASDLQGRILYRTASGIRRLNLDGSRDMSFGNRGTASTVAGYDHLDIDSQGRLIAWRVIRGGAADGDIQIARLTQNGKLDATFGGGDGMSVVDTRFSSTADANVIVTQDNKIVATAMQRESAKVRWSATRLLG